MQRTYKYSIIYFLVFSLLLLTSSILIFNDKMGFSVNSIVAYYNGNEALFIPAKTKDGILQILLPHIFAFGLFLMVSLHFLIFTKHRNKKQTQLLIYFIFTMAFLELSSPFLIINGFHFFAYVKILSFFGFELSLLYLFWLLFYSIVYD